MIDISKAFAPTSEPISGFFQQLGAAYYIPLCQREYSWESENSTYSHHMESIVGVPTNGQLDRRLVKGRTKRISELSWNRVAPWLNLLPI